MSTLEEMVLFIHLLIALGLIVLVVYGLFYTKKSALSLSMFNLPLLIFAALALLTGTALVHVRHISFDIFWVKAAYVLVGSFTLILILLMAYNKKIQGSRLQHAAYALLLAILIAVVHGAVTKIT